MADHSIVEGFNALDGKVTEFRFSNPRMVVSKDDTVIENNIVTDIIVPFDPSLISLKFKENQQSVDSSISINVANVRAPAINCRPPRSHLNLCPQKSPPKKCDTL